MANWKVSRNYDVRTVEQESVSPIDVFEDQVRGWVFFFAEELAKMEHSGISVLMLATSYFEPIASFLSGEDSNGRSSEFFKRGVKEVFPELAASQHIDAVSKLVYGDLRNGLFHGGMIRGRITIVPEGPAIELVQSKNNLVGVALNARAFLQAVESHFENYVRKLRNRDPANDTLRRNFDSAWAIRVGDGQATDVPSPSEIALSTNTQTRSSLHEM